MIKSMTGFGVCSFSIGEDRYNIELKSVNGRFLEIKFKGIQLDLSLEDEIKKIIQFNLQRGTVFIKIDSELKNNVKRVFDREKYELLKGILKDINIKYGQSMNMSDIISSNDLLKINDPKFPDDKELIKKVEIALMQLIDMRKIEGERIFNDTLGRINKIKEIIATITEKTNNYKSEKQDILRVKIKELLNGEDLDESRLIQEVAYFSEKMDVTEEIVRCNSHFDQLNNYLRINEPVGKRINFLLQEIVREINTIGSKSSQTDVIMHVVEIKDELEKIREQMQNIL